jgi:hypothetical protein
MADWRELYKAAVLETNPTQLERLITETEDAIFLRVGNLPEVQTVQKNAARWQKYRRDCGL